VSQLRGLRAYRFGQCGVLAWGAGIPSNSATLAVAMSTRDRTIHDAASPPAVTGEAEIAPGEVIGRYIVVGAVGHGGMGTVYRAYDTQLNRTLAIKILHRELTWSEGADEVALRMQREAQAMARLTHPNVVVVHDVGTFDRRVFLAMEFVDGGTLKQWLKGDHTRDERLAVMKAAGRGLAAAHAAGLIHRDFKPDNVLVGKDGRVLVTDFGIARLADDPEPDSVKSPEPGAAASAHEGEQPPSSRTEPLPIRSVVPASSSLAPSSLTNAATLTLPGSILGTVGYMAPEQAFGEATTAASDQFSFCVTLYTALYGRNPFRFDGLSAYFVALERPLAAPPSGADVPGWIHKIIVRGLSRLPEDRFPSMDALLAALDADPAIRSRPRRTIAVAIFALALTATGVGFAMRARTDECAPDPADMKGVWDDAAKSDLTGAFDRSGAPGAHDTAARVIAVMNDTASKWTAMKAESCDATRLKKRQPEDAYRLRAECLDRRRSELRALSRSFRVADKDVVAKAVAAAYGLTNVAVCADVPMLRKSGGLPDAPAARAQVIEARTELATATSFQLVGKLTESGEHAEHALGLARASGHDSTVAEALRILGALKVEQSEHAQAERLLTESTWTASKAGADSQVVTTASMLAFVVGSKLGRPGEARIWLGVAEAALSRVGVSQELELQYEEHKSWLMADADGRAEETLPSQERIAQTYQQLYGVHPRTLRALYNLGDGLTSAGRHAEACDVYARAITMGEAVGGPNYSWTGYSLAGRGDCLIAQGDYVDGDKALARAVQIFEATSDEYSEVEALEVVVRSALAQGDTERAITTARTAIALIKTLEGTASLVAIADVPIAEALMRAPPAPDAEALCREALRQQELLGQIDPAKTLRADALRCLGDALILDGRPQEALAPLERSLTLLHRTYPGDFARAEYALARALVLTGGDAARAKDLARRAHDDFAATPGLGVEAEVVRKWLATR
jgi:serine/threonine protein kinase/tetratricopeptide (TPR) repeat protein